MIRHKLLNPSELGLRGLLHSRAKKLMDMANIALLDLLQEPEMRGY